MLCLASVWSELFHVNATDWYITPSEHIHQSAQIQCPVRRAARLSKYHASTYHTYEQICDCPKSLRAKFACRSSRLVLYHPIQQIEISKWCARLLSFSRMYGCHGIAPHALRCRGTTPVPSDICPQPSQTTEPPSHHHDCHYNPSPPPQLIFAFPCTCNHFP